MSIASMVTLRGVAAMIFAAHPETTTQIARITSLIRISSLGGIWMGTKETLSGIAGSGICAAHRTSEKLQRVVQFPRASPFKGSQNEETPDEG
jgi:hypothetical protein